MSDQENPQRDDHHPEAHATSVTGGTPEPLDALFDLEECGHQPTPAPKRPRRRRPRREPALPLSTLFDLDDPSMFGGAQKQP